MILSHFRDDKEEIVKCINCCNFTNKKDFYKHYDMCSSEKENTICLETSNSTSNQNNIKEERTNRRRNAISYNNFDDFIENKTYYFKTSKKEIPIYKKCHDCTGYFELPDYNNHLLYCKTNINNDDSSQSEHISNFDIENENEDLFKTYLINTKFDGVINKKIFINNNRNNNINIIDTTSEEDRILTYRKCEFCSEYILIQKYQPHLILEHREKSKYVYNKSKYYYELNDDISVKTEILKKELLFSSFNIMNYYYLRDILKKDRSYLPREIDDKLSTFQGISDALKKINRTSPKFKNSIRLNNFDTKGKLSIFYDIDNNKFDYYIINHFKEQKCLYVLCNKSNVVREGYTEIIRSTVHLNLKKEEDIDLPQYIKDYKLQVKTDLNFTQQNHNNSNASGLILLTELLFDRLPQIICNINVELFDTNLSFIQNEDARVFEEIMNFNNQFKINFFKQVVVDSYNALRLEEYNILRINGRDINIMDSNHNYRVNSNSSRSRLSHSNIDDNDLMLLQGFNQEHLESYPFLSRGFPFNMFDGIFTHIRNIINLTSNDGHEFEGFRIIDLSSDIFPLISMDSTGLSKEQLVKYIIKEDSYQGLSKEDEDKIENDDCFVCYEKFKNTQLIKMPCCRNIMHFECALKWFIIEKKSECPLCKKDLKETD